MRRSARKLGKGPVAPAGREGVTTRASSSRFMADDDPEPRMDDDECPAADGSFSTRFSASRLRQIADRQPKSKKDVIRLCSFGSLLNINSFSIPADLLDWVVMKIDRENSLFSHRHKSILFTKDMVRKKFNVPSGSRAVELLRRNEPHVLREPYRVGLRAPTRRTIEVLELADVLDVVTIKRAWVLLCIAMVLSRGTGNMVPLEYLASLVDMDSIIEFAWDGHFLAVVLNDIKKYKKKRNEGKLPSRSLRHLAETPYVRLDGCCETRHQNNKFVRTDAHIPDISSNSTFDGCKVGGDVCGSLDEWLHPLPSSEEMEGTMAALQGLALEFDDGPSMSLFKEGTEDFEWLNMDDDTTGPTYGK
ncbi:hypothetical protein D1007_54015 [Hordeum vulgare]|nr:hypothetical protein D1007_54015 [Hordeum vulgare]